MSTAEKLMEKGKIEGKIEGKLEELHALLLEMLGLKFGPISDEIKNKVLNISDVIKLENALKGLLTAQKIEEITSKL
jgi:predicted transposase YdaD